MRHKISILSVAAAALFAFSSCGEDFLYKAPQGSIDEEALTNAEGVELLITAAYAGLTQDNGFENEFNWVFGGVYGGDANKGSDTNDQSVVNSIETYSLVATNSYLLVKWEDALYGTNRCNIALNVLKNVTDMDDDTKEQREAELKFLRCLLMFEGVKMFGDGIPYIDEETAASANDPKVYNQLGNNYELLLEDINAAIAVLPEKQTEVARPTLTAAKALKAKILMQMGDMDSAKPILADIVENGYAVSGNKLTLQEDLNTNWSALTENGDESIFEVQFSVGAMNNGNYGFCLNYPYGTGPGGCCGFYQPSYELVNSFQVDENGLPYLNGEYRDKASVTNLTTDGSLSENDYSIAVDPRLDFTVGRMGIPYKDWGLPTTDWIRNVSNGGPFMPKKHVFSSAELDAGLAGSAYAWYWAPGSAMNIQYLSLRDCKLLYAECLANDGELTAAMEQVNDIRERAANEANIIYLDDGTPAANYLVKTYPSSHAAFSDQATCIKAIRMERKLELAMEGQRFFDLARWGGDYMNSELTEYLNYEKQYISKFYGVTAPSADKTIYPIPSTEIATAGTDENGEYYLKQNSAWE